MKIFAFSGLGADKRVFDHLRLDHELIPIEWISPKNKEPIISYAKRLIEKFKLNEQKDIGILGVSFGGLIAVEISKIIQPKITVLISSVALRSDLSRLIKFAGKTNIIELIPKNLLDPPRAIAHFMFGTKEKALLNAILDDTDVHFTKWALRELMNWKNETPLPNLIVIGGSKDKLLPPKNENSILIDQGAHFMIVDKASLISEIINKELMGFYSQ